MSPEERAEVARRLADLMGDRIPVIRSDQDLIEYYEDVRIRRYYQTSEGEFTELSIKVRRIDPKFDAKIRREQEKFWRGIQHRRDLHRGGTKSLRQRGDETQKRVQERWKALKSIPEHNRAATIAKALGVSERTARRHINKLGL